MLASISRSPTNYNPFTNPENLITRRNHVLAEMRNQGYITEEECNAAMAETITLAETSDVNDTKAYSSNNSYFTEAVITQLTKDLMEVYGYETVAEAQSHIFNDGLRIYSLHDARPELAWQITASGPALAECCLISADSGEVLFREDRMLVESVSAAGEAGTPRGACFQAAPALIARTRASTSRIHRRPPRRGPAPCRRAVFLLRISTPPVRALVLIQ